VEEADDGLAAGELQPVGLEARLDARRRIEDGGEERLRRAVGERAQVRAGFSLAVSGSEAAEAMAGGAGLLEDGAAEPLAAIAEAAEEERERKRIRSGDQEARNPGGSDESVERGNDRTHPSRAAWSSKTVPALGPRLLDS
jgi:hypothetical protein